MFLTATEAVYVLRGPKPGVQSPKSEIDDLRNPTHDSRLPTPDSKAVAVYMRLAGANEEANFVPSQELFTIKRFGGVASYAMLLAAEV